MGSETTLPISTLSLPFCRNISHCNLFPLLQPASGREVYQIDLVPTTALALGLPIPFSNLGMLIPEVLLPFSGKDGSDDPGDAYSRRVTLDFLTALRANAEQIHNYLVTYTEYSQDFPRETFDKLEGDFQRVVRDHRYLLEASGEETSQDKMTAVAAAYFSYMREVKLMCQSIWAKFDILPMVLGLCLLTLTVLATPLMLLNVTKSSVSLSNSVPAGFALGVVGTAFSALFAGVETSLPGLLSLVGTTFLVSLTAILFIFVWNFSTVIRQSVDTLRRNVHRVLHRVTFEAGLSVAVILLHAVSMLSNSFILYEADMLAFFIQSVVLVLAARRLKRELSKGASGAALLMSIVPHLALMGCVRLSKLFYACRDLQLQDGCESTTFILPLASAAEFLGPSLTVLRCVVSVLAHYAVCIGVLVYLRKNKLCRFLDPYLVRGCEMGLLLSVFYVMAHWYTRYYTHTAFAFPLWLHVAFPRTVYAISGALIVLCIVRPFRRLPKLLSCEDPSLDTPTEARLDVTTLSGEAVQTNTEQSHAATRIPVRSLVVMATAILLAALWSPATMVLNDGITMSAALSAAEMVLALLILQCSEEGR